MKLGAIQTDRQDSILQLEDIKRILPHRYPFLLIDRVISMEDGLRCRAIKNVTGNEEFFNGHFPNNPIMPGVLIVEAMAQACGILAFSVEKDPEGKFLMFSGIEKARFRAPVVPGDQLVLDVEFIKRKMNFASFKAEARVQDKVTTQAELRMAMVGNFT